MARTRTADLPDLSGLRLPPDSQSLAVEQSVMRHRVGTKVAASLAEQVAARLASAIAFDLIHPGQRLLEQDLCEVLEVSRAPVREALRILERDRLVEFQARKGALVTAPDPKQLRDVFNVRAALYGLLIRAEMERDPAVIGAVLDAHMPAVERAANESPNDYAVATFLLNYAMSDVADNRALADLLQSVSLQTLRYVRLALVNGPRDVSSSLNSWRALHAAVRGVGVERAVEIAEGRIMAVRDAALLSVTKVA